MRVGLRSWWRVGLLSALVAAVWLWVASSASAQSPVRFGQLQLASTSVTWTYGDATASGSNCVNSSGMTQSGTASLSADGQGDALITFGQGAPTALAGKAYPIYVTGSGQLEFAMSGSASSSEGPYTRSLTMDGYGTSFAGTMNTTLSAQGGTCYFTRPMSLSLQSSGLTFASQAQQQVDSTATQTQTQVQKALNDSVKSTVQNLQATFDATSPGTVENTLAEGPGGSGYPLLVFEGSGGAGSSVLVFDGAGGSGSSVLTFDGGGGSGSSVLVFDGGGSGGSSVLTFDGSGGSGSSVLTFEGSGGSGSSILAPPTLGPGSVNDTIAFDGSSGSGSTVAGDAWAARAQYPKKVKLCIRKHKGSPAKCQTLKAVPVPFIAHARKAFSTAGKHSLPVPVSKAGNLILIATREADRLYHKHHPHGHHEPKLKLKLVVSYKKS